MIEYINKTRTFLAIKKNDDFYMQDVKGSGPVLILPG